MADEQAQERQEGPSSRVLTRQRLLAVCAALLVAVTTSSSGQTPAVDNSPAAAAARALNAGQFDQVETLLRSATDERSIVLRARAAIARGRYTDAEKLLAGIVSSAPAGDAALELGQLYLYLGRRDEGARLLQAVLTRGARNSPADVMRLGLAARALGRFQDANSFLRSASGMAPDDPAINTAWGELFLEKYNRADAVRSFQVALKVDATYVPARIGLAHATLDENPPAAKSAAEGVLEVNPNYVPAHLLIAELALDDRQRDGARASIRKALEVNPNSLEARSLDAAIALLEARTSDFETAVAGVLKINPVYGDVYRMAGDHLARNYRFDEAVALTRRALELDRASTRAYADLGMHLLRTGDEPGSRRALETAFKADPFDVVTFNLLAMLDTVDKFETIRDGDLVIRLHPDEAGVMREHVVPLARQALDTLSKQYQFKPMGPILIEMFPKHDDFAVRTIGLPGFIGALGACFGRVVTLDSPRARPPGQFSWTATLWHEMMHVISLQMSNNRLPRWLSEGMSQFEERRARPEWGREMEVPFAQALDAGKLLKLRDLNEGFSDPRMISLVYHQSSLVVGHLIDTYGEPRLWQLLRAYGKGLETDAAFKEAYNTTLDDIQASFDARLERDYAGLRRALKTPEIPDNPTVDQLKALAAANPGSFGVQMTLAQALDEAGNASAAIEALERASQLVPVANGEANPHTHIARIAMKQGDTARAIRALEAVVKVESSDVESARQLAKLVAPLGDAARTAAVYGLVAELDPFDVQAQAVVGRRALQQRDAARAQRAFRAALAAGPADKAAAYLDLAEAYFLAGQLGDAKRDTLAALEIAPSFERAQDLLLKIITTQPAGAGVGTGVGTGTAP
ncbi:MAG: tetratricopeptide repeat protein [Acidobacteria bacterium]|nr:tetratricopeptide repeat protein [Acidobacteriota bacterium]